METLMQWENGMMRKNKPTSISSSYSYMESEVIMSKFCQGISRVLSEWNGLQMAIQNEWGGHDSNQKSQQLVFDIFSWFCQSKGSLSVEELENFLHETMLFSFNTDIEDGSIEEVAEQLMNMHEGCLNGCYT
ncbi:pre-rRNA-processing protein TSR2 homolog isoform X2 [Chenopodium quinoa]|uniref:pre-rRNA-processing protein TSR2 homolog isoform X2 n=1 Tax=Chenopodium quinoa TaxID=63459 RepID=UPI000B7923F6|nr:pre-rRNA-processing protein TSR2 homolog isoform X2 [Chenopodium quinoa]